ncbi:MAG TPA: hypothetical protein VKU00_08845 [Chthonomonadaceae bacterium]|nr:hypothetical protein [Chthonomonadaceae bacterium]
MLTARTRMFLCSLLILVIGSCASQAFAQPQQAAAHDAAWVEQRIQELQPTAQERRIDEIGWAKDILSAKQLAQKSNRPVFLFTHDGRIGTGRC